MPTQISHTCLRAGKNVLIKEEQGIPFSTTKIPLAMWEKNSMSKGRLKSIGVWDTSNIPVSNQYYSL